MNKPSAIPIPMHAEGTEKKNHKKKCKNPRTCFGGHVYQKDGLFIHFLFAEQPLDFLIHYSLLDSFYNSFCLTAKTSQ